MKHSHDCFCIKCQQEDIDPRPSKVLITLAIAAMALAFTFAGQANAADDFKDRPLEPAVHCFGQAAVLTEADGGLVLPMKAAVDLCQGVTSRQDAANVVSCFRQAFHMAKLSLRMSVDLCRKGRI